MQISIIIQVFYLLIINYGGLLEDKLQLHQVLHQFSKNNGIGEDIVFVRTLIKELQDKNNFIIMRNPLLVKRASSTRKETQWSKDLSIGENKTLPQVAELIKCRT